MTDFEREILAKLVARLKLEDVDPESISGDTLLFGQGLSLDSIDALEIELMVKEDYGIVILTAERTRSTFGTLGVLCKFIQDNMYRDIPKDSLPSLPGQKTTSSPNGRDVELAGYPIRAAEMLATLEGSAYVVRRSLHDPKNIRLAKKAIRMAFETQLRGLGFSMVELLSTCPTNWGMTPAQSQDWLAEHMLPYYPRGDYKVSPALAQVKV